MHVIGGIEIAHYWSAGWAGVHVRGGQIGVDVEGGGQQDRYELPGAWLKKVEEDRHGEEGVE